jgi:hypothetical protein
MARLVSKTGQGSIQVPDNLVAEALAKNPDLVLDSAVSVDLGGGNHGLVAPENYVETTLNPGTYGQVDTADTALDAANQAHLAEKYGDQNIAAAVTGLARGATLGLSDVLLARDEDSRFELEQIRTQNGIISTATEIGGALAPALFTGGESLFASALRATPAGALTRLGASAASRVAGESVATAALRGAIQTSIEGAGMGLGNGITQAALHDDQFTVESVASNMALGGVLGGVTGGLLGAGGAVARRVLMPASASTPVDKLALGLSKVDGNVDDMLARETASHAETEAAILQYDDALKGNAEYKAAQNAWKKQVKTDAKVYADRTKQELAEAARLRDESYLAEMEQARAAHKAEIDRITYENKITETARKEQEQLFKRLVKEETATPAPPQKEIAALEARVRDLDRRIFLAQKAVPGTDQLRIAAQFEDAQRLLSRKGAAAKAGGRAAVNDMPAVDFDELRHSLITKGKGAAFKGGTKAAALDSLEAARREAQDQLAKLHDDYARTLGAHKQKLAAGMNEATQLDELAKRELQQLPEKFTPPPKPSLPEPAPFVPAEFVPPQQFIDALGPRPSGADRSLYNQAVRARSGLRTYLGADLDAARILTLPKDQVRYAVQHLDEYTRAVTALDDKTGGQYGASLELGEQAIRQQLDEVPGLAQSLDAIDDVKVAEVIGKDAAWVAKLTPPAKTALKAWTTLQAQAPEEVAKRGVLSKLFVSSMTGAGRNAIPSGVRGSGMFSNVVRGAARNVGGFIGSKVGRMAAGAVGGYAVGGKEGAMTGAGVAVLGAGAGPAVAKRMGSLVARAVAALAKPTTAKGITAAAILGATKFGQDEDKDPARARMKEIAAAVSNPATMRAIQTATIPLYLQNPAVGEKVQAALQARLTYIAQQSPWRPPEKAFRTFRVEPSPSRYEVAKWARVVRAAEDPLTLLEDLEHRRLTPEAVRTVRDLYPELFTRMQSTVLEQVAVAKQSLPYQSRLQVATFFDTPIDASQTPEFGATIQGLYATAAESTPQPRGSLGQPSPDQTQTQRLTSPT